MNISPTPATAALAGTFAGLVMPELWTRFAGDSLIMLAAFLLLVALPAHAFVVGFNSSRRADGAKAVDIPQLMRVGAWLLAAIVVSAVMHVVRA